jgi:uncharacterized protein
MQESISDLINLEKKYAVIGASDSPEKYGYKVYKRLKRLGYTVYPVNPRRELVQGDKSYDNLYSLPEKVDVLNFVVPPDVSAKVTQTAIKIGYKVFWYQPGSFSKEVAKIHVGQDTQVINDHCILIETQHLAS